MIVLGPIPAFRRPACSGFFLFYFERLEPVGGVTSLSFFLLLFFMSLVSFIFAYFLFIMFICFRFIIPGISTLECAQTLDRLSVLCTSAHYFRHLLPLRLASYHFLNIN